MTTFWAPLPPILNLKKVIGHPSKMLSTNEWVYIHFQAHLIMGGY